MPEFNDGFLGVPTRPGKPREVGITHVMDKRLNLRDIEQALENFKRLPTVESDIVIEPAEAPGESDLLITWRQSNPFRLNLSLDDGGACTAARISIGAAAPTVLLVEDAGAALVGSKFDDAALVKLAEAVRAACSPIDDKRGSAEYRIAMAGVLARRTVKIALERAQQKGGHKA